jgi:dihydrofolate reductase
MAFITPIILACGYGLVYNPMKTISLMAERERRRQGAPTRMQWVFVEGDSMDRAQKKIILAAMTEAQIIGRHGAIPWHLPEELQLFRQLTVGHTLIMGRRTFESIGRPLPNRRNLVVSRSLRPVSGIEICRSFAEAMRRAGGDDDLFFIGGRSIYVQALPIADFLRISWIFGSYPGDAFFPPWRRECWEAAEIREFPTFRHILYRRSSCDTA